MADPRDKVTLGNGAEEGANPSSSAGRKWLSIIYRCANQYGRAYCNAAGTAYSGRCPKCGHEVRFSVGEGGTDARTFEVSCLG